MSAMGLFPGTLNLFDFTDESIVNLNFLFTETIFKFYCFVYSNLFNKRIQKFSGQFRRIGIPLHFSASEAVCLLADNSNFSFWILSSSSICSA